MIIHSKILNNFIKNTNNLKEVTSDHITEVDHYENLQNDLIVTGKVIKTEMIANTDHLKLTQVDVGKKKLQIVCGAANVEKGDYVIVAKIGAVLPGNFEIKPVVLRGHESNGMICSLDELGVNIKDLEGIDTEGIYQFPNEVELGVGALPLIGMERELLTLEITPNRGDLLSHLGFANDFAAMTNQKVEVNKPIFKEIDKKNPIEIQLDTNNVVQYHTRVIKVNIGPSPLWLQNYLIDLGIRPINNVVDITNYVLFELGTPLHAFDRSKVGTDKIVVRQARNNEEVKALDEEEYNLNKDDLVITNGNEPIAIGGVMGLLNTSTDYNTKEIILEAAQFNPTAIRETSNRLSLSSDSSYRFERGIDYDRVILGLNRATELIVKYAGGRVYDGIKGEYNESYEHQVILINNDDVNNLLGTSFTLADIKNILSKYQFEVKVEKNNLAVKVPASRLDIEIKEDLIEEIVRAYGLNNIDNEPLLLEQQGELGTELKLIRVVKSHLASVGFNEVITYSLIGEEVTRFDDKAKPLKLLMPMSEHKKYLRTELLNGLLDTLVYNNARNYEKDYSLFEIGKVFSGSEERNHLGLLITNNIVNNEWQNKFIKADFYLLKGILEQTIELIGEKLELRPAESKGLHPGMTAKVYLDDQEIGIIGRLHPAIEQELKLDATYLADIDLTTIITNPKEDIQFSSITKYPSVSRDIAVIVKKDVLMSDIIKIIKQTGRKYLTNCELFDIYQGDNINEDEHSLAFSLVFNDSEKTMDKNEIDKIIKSITNRLKHEFSATLRE